MTEPVKMLPVSSLRPYPGNPRDYSASLDSVCDSIRRYGFNAPLVALAGSLEVLAGHARLAAAKKLGLVEVPVRLVDLPPEAARAYVLADNKLGEIAEWDESLLAEALAALEGEEASGLLRWPPGGDAAPSDALVALAESEESKQNLVLIPKLTDTLDKYEGATHRSFALEYRDAVLLQVLASLLAVDPSSPSAAVLKALRSASATNGGPP